MREETIEVEAKDSFTSSSSSIILFVWLCLPLSDTDCENLVMFVRREILRYRSGGMPAHDALGERSHKDMLLIIQDDWDMWLL